jgi:hypothetical protein
MLGSGLSFSTTMPGGFEQATVTLPRRIGIDMPDLAEFATVRWVSPGGTIAFEGRLQASPRQAGNEQTVNPEITGWQAHFDDFSACREIYLDSQLNAWIPESLSQKIADSASWDVDDATVAPDPSSGAPALVTGFTGPWSRNHSSKANYDGKGISLGGIYYSLKLQQTGGAPTISPSDTHWSSSVGLQDNDVQAGLQQSANLVGAAPTSGFMAANSGSHTFALVELHYTAPGGGSGVFYGVDWTYLGLIGWSGVPIQGSLTTGGIGVLASDVIANAISRWAPKMGFSLGPTGTLTPTAFVIPQAAYPDPTTVSQIIADVSKYELLSWAVWEGPTFYLTPLGYGGRYWQARVREAQLQETRPQVDRIYNGVIVTFTDATGITRAVGPPGSGCQYTDPSLQDPDPTNAATAAGLLRYSPPLALGTSSLAIAVQAGARYLNELKQRTTAGQAQIVGHVEDAMTGTFQPAWLIRAGDWISFVDASDISYRHIVSTSYDDSSKTNTLSLDSPPDDMQALLERMNVAIQNVA